MLSSFSIIWYCPPNATQADCLYLHDVGEEEVIVVEEVCIVSLYEGVNWAIEGMQWNDNNEKKKRN